MPARATFGVHTLVEAVRRQVAASSLREVADDIGMSRSGVHVLLRGSKPQPKTMAKLVAWYAAKQGAQSGTAISTRDVDAAVQLLARYATADGRESVRARRVREIVQRLESEVGGG